jgi:hypothetical protein
MKNNFDLKGYMKENKVGSYQQLNEMWYQDINQALGDFNVIKEEEMQADTMPVKVSLEYADYPSISNSEQKRAINQFMKLVKSLGGNATKTGDKFSTIDFEITGGPSFEELQAAYDKEAEDPFASSLASWELDKSELEEQEMEMEEGKKKLAFVIPCPDAYDIEEEAEHFQYLLDKAGVKAKVKANQVGEEAEVYTKDEKKARKVIEKNGYQIGWTEDNNLEEMGGVKNIGDKAKMATPNARPNLGRHRSSDTLDKQVAKDHDKKTVTGAKAAAYKAPHMKEEETADDIFAGSDTADWNGKAERMDWEKDLVGKEVGNWKSDIEQQAGSISWTSEKYPNAIIYATPGWEGVDGIAVEVHESEDGFMDEPKLQKVVAAGTDLWKTKEGYLALMAKIFTTLEKMLTPAEMTEDHGTQINHDMNDDISTDHTEPEHMVQNEDEVLPGSGTPDEDDYSKMKPAIPAGFYDYDEEESGIDDDKLDRFYDMGGRQLTKAAEALLDDGFSKREIIDYLQNYM